MNKKTIRVVFVFFLFFLPVQYGLIGLISLYKSEPWPAFIFPGFKNVYVFEDETYAIVDLEFHAWCEEMGERVVISPLTLFSDIPRSQSQGFLRMNFREAADGFDVSTLVWLREETEARFPGHQFTHMDAVWTENFYSGSGLDAAADSTVEIDRLTILF